MRTFDILETPLGQLFIIFEGGRLISLSFTERPRIKASRAPERMRRELEEYFSGERTAFGIDLSLEGATEFERSVWLGLRDIPYGETRTYKWLAEHVGRPKAARAVGQALSRNPIPVVLPCHRVIESGGSLGGYSEGESIKRRLLKMEYYHTCGAEDEK